VTDAAPVSLHVFIDESHRGSMYLLASALVRPGDLDSTRVLMRSLRVPGERKLHFKSERDAVKKDVAAALVSAQVRTRVYLGRGQSDAVREQCLRAAVSDLASMGLRRLVLDRRWPDGNVSDRRIILAALLGARMRPDAITYEHLRSHEEPALWIADAVAWCYGAGGEWRRRVEPIVESVTDVGYVSRQRRPKASQAARSPGSRRPTSTCPGSLPRPSGLG
jgi:hypothetical protein